MSALLEVKNLCVQTYAGGKRNSILNNVSFDVQEKESLALIGESGSGKSLTALSIVRLLPDNLIICGGDIHFQKQSLLRLAEVQMQRVRGGSIGFIFQEPMTSLNPVITIGQQILEVVYRHRAMRTAQAREYVLSLLDDVGIVSPHRVFASYPHELSGGMKQRAVIAMALVGEPRLLIADEPTTALDVSVQAQILDLLESLKHKLGMAVLFISHDLAVASKTADRIAVMKDGEIVEQLPTQNFFQDARHQYSRGLLKMLPDINKRGESLSGETRHFEPPRVIDETIIEVDQIKVHFPIKKGIFKRTVDSVKAVDGVSFSLSRGKTFALVGESGSGKTTIARALLRLIEPTAGNVSFLMRGDDSGYSHDLGWDDFVRRTQIVFQDPFSSLNPKMPVGEAIGEGIRVRSPTMQRAHVDEKVAGLLVQVGLSPDHACRYPHQFSGGQRQRLCIARALAVEPEFIILDEPTSALDILVQAQILDLFQRLQADYGLGYLLITHDISVVAYMADELAVIHHGRIVEQGEVVQLLNNPRVDYTRNLLAAVPSMPE